MALDELDIKLLNVIYEKDYNNIPIDWEKLNFESNNHKAFHLQRLERNGYVEMDDTVLVPAGRRDPKYGTAIGMIFSDGIHITEKGVKAIK